MAEYIERDKKKLARLRKEAQQFQDDIVCAVGTDFMQTIAEAENRMKFDILKGLENAPAADVVEVVRCKDCKYWENAKYYEPYCNHWGNMMTDTTADDYCSCGERKG